ncbi:hypothetical protein ACIBQX_11405 [Nonomuraea sp. NPDC049714]|uniref:hypothetical protein n=1 Tax=Nonomuraea sp. NPDC049714 TaxID=3364357 RepID=UPI0037A1570E
MDFMYVAGQILLGILLLCSALGSFGAVNALLWIWQEEFEGAKIGPLGHGGVWLGCVLLMAGIIHASILNGWLGMGQVSA